jgi:hypothetical protein
MPEKPIDLSKYYDADTLRAFTTDEYETRKRLYTDRQAAKDAATKIYEKDIRPPRYGLSFDELVTRWSDLEPAIRKYLELDNEIKRLDDKGD